MKNKKRSYALWICLILAITGAICYPFGKQLIQDMEEKRMQQEFIEKVAMPSQDIYEKYGVLPSITIAQAILESDWGRSDLSVEANNYFGIKGSYQNQSVTMTTAEFENEQEVSKDEVFKKYDTFITSLEDHAALLVDGTTWNADQYQSVLSASDYEEAARQLQASGYATDPDYAKKLIEVIQAHDLMKYDT